jgi:NAD-dependent dihydropyrimidine dehydrogenase PreA subunit
MTKRKIIKIDEKKCNGCGLCLPNCPEGALQIIDNKARLISDIFCDGLGACIGTCPRGAIKTIEREAETYNEKKVIKENIIPAGKNTIIAHLKHLKEHGETRYLKEALDVLKEEDIDVDFDEKTQVIQSYCVCPGIKEKDFSEEIQKNVTESLERISHLQQWPVQLHLVNPNAMYFQKKDVVLAADCAAYAFSDFHKEFLKDKALAIACPKLDTNKDIYIDKIAMMIDDAKINMLTVIIMEVTCCSGLLFLVKQALKKSDRKIPVKNIVISLKGKILKDELI